MDNNDITISMRKIRALRRALESIAWSNEWMVENGANKGLAEVTAKFAREIIAAIDSEMKGN